MLRSVATCLLPLALSSCGFFKSGSVSDAITRGLIYPMPDAQNVDTDRPFEWAWDGPPARYRATIYDGATVAVQSPWMGETHWVVPQDLPADRFLTLKIEIDSEEKTEFVSKLLPSFKITVPRHGTRLETAPESLRWLSMGEGIYYVAEIGTTRGGTDLLAPKTIRDSAFSLSGVSLPRDVNIFVSVRAFDRGGKQLRRADSVFLIGSTAVSATTNSASDADRHLFEWPEDPRALGYSFEIYESGALVKRYPRLDFPAVWINDLSPGTFLMKGISIYREGAAITEWNFRRETAHQSSEAEFVEVAQELSRRLHLQARDTRGGPHIPHSGSPLYWSVAGRHFGANCSDYSKALNEALIRLTDDGEQRSRVRFAGFLVNGVDGHTLVEVRSVDRWITLDPTFGVRIKISGQDATKEEVQDSVLSGDTSRLTFDALAEDSLHLLKGYYIDYALLFLNLSPFINDPSVETDIRPFTQNIASLSSGNSAAYVVSTPHPAEVSATVNGAPRTILTSTHGRLAFSSVIWAQKISVEPSPGVQLLTLKRPIFH